MAECVKVLLGESPQRLNYQKHINTNIYYEDLNVCAVETIKNVMAYHCSHWPALSFNYDLPKIDQYFFNK